MRISHLRFLACVGSICLGVGLMLDSPLIFLFGVGWCWAVLVYSAIKFGRGSTW